MEEDEVHRWPAHIVSRKTLNEDPTNVLAEELAMEVCKQGFDVAQELMETEMVTTSCGSLVKGTPDGGFRDSDGLLRLVQVVRVPLLPEMDADDVAEVLHGTVLGKIVKSQAWMRETRTLPYDFTIFCWLPPVGAYRVCLAQSEALLWTEALIWNMRAGGWPFSLKLKVPTDPGCIFPPNFGLRKENHGNTTYLNDLCYFLNPIDFEDDDEPMEWYLFDEDFDDEIQVESTTADAASDLHALIACAIKMIEERVALYEEEADRHALAALFVIEEGDCGGEAHRIASQLLFAGALRSDAACPGEHGPRKPPLKIPIDAKRRLVVVVEGLPWWDLGRKCWIIAVLPWQHVA